MSGPGKNFQLLTCPKTRYLKFVVFLYCFILFISLIKGTSDLVVPKIERYLVISVFMLSAEHYFDVSWGLPDLSLQILHFSTGDSKRFRLPDEWLAVISERKTLLETILVCVEGPSSVLLQSL